MSNFDYGKYFNDMYVIAFENNFDWYNVMKELSGIAFTWYPSIKYDSNRAEDGVQLRRDYLFENPDIHGRDNVDERPSSFFEVYLGLAKKMSHMLDCDLKTAVSYMLSIGPFEPDMSMDEVTKTAVSVMVRDYEPNGDGGLFPLHNPPRDQRYVELLYQLNLHVLEQELGR